MCSINCYCFKFSSLVGWQTTILNNAFYRVGGALGMSSWKSLGTTGVEDWPIICKTTIAQNVKIYKILNEGHQMIKDLSEENLQIYKYYDNFCSCFLWNIIWKITELV